MALPFAAASFKILVSLVVLFFGQDALQELVKIVLGSFSVGGSKIRTGVSFSEFKKEFITKSFFNSLSIALGAFVTFVKDYNGDNENYIRAKNNIEALESQGITTEGFLATEFWQTIKNIPFGDAVKVLTYSTNPIFWQIITTFGFFINKQNLDITFEIPEGTELADVSALNTEITAITNSNFNFSNSEIEDKYNTIINSLLLSNSKFFVFYIKNTLGYMIDVNGGWTSEAVTNDYIPLFFAYPTQDIIEENVLFSKTATKGGYSSKFYKPALDVNDFQIEVVAPGEVGSLIDGAQAASSGQWSIRSNHNLGIFNLLYDANKDIVNFNGCNIYSNDYPAEYKYQIMDMYGTRFKEGYITDLSVQLSNEIITTKKVGKEFYNEQVDAAIVDGSYEILTPSSVIDSQGKVIGDTTVRTDVDTLTNILEQVEAGTITWAEAMEKLKANAANATQTITSDIAQTKAEAITNIQAQDQISPSVPSKIPVPGSNLTGLYKMFNPSLTQIKQLGNTLWDVDILEQLKRVWDNPMESIIALMLYPVKPYSGSLKRCYLGFYDTGIDMQTVENQFLQIKVGEIYVEPKFNNFLDLAGYTSVDMYIPFVGYRSLNVDEVMGSVLSLYYTVDFLSGNFVASIYSSKVNDSIMNFSGNMASHIPLTSGNQIGLIQKAADITLDTATSFAAGGGPAALATAATGVIGSLFTPNSNVQKSGNITGVAGVLGPKIPYLIINRPKLISPENFASTNGYISRKGGIVGDFEGWTQFKNVKLEIDATTDEIEEIMSLLESGVYV